MQPDGSLDITETQTLDFQGEPFTFGFRSIPVGRQGNNDGITNISVREGDQVYTESSSYQPGTFQVVDNNGETRINWYFEPALGERTYTFSYTVDGAVRTGTAEEGSGDQIFWTVIPSDHPARVDSSRITITLPEGVYPQRYYDTNEHLVAAYLNNVQADNVIIDVSEDERVITFQSQQSIMPGTALDVRVQVPHGLLPIETPGWQVAEQRDDAVGLTVLALSLLLFVIGPLGVVLLWYLRGRDPHTGLVVPDYVTEPPDALPPAMAGSLIDEKVDTQDILSTLVDLAHRGYIVMEEINKSYSFTRTDKSDSDLRKFERSFLKDFFQGDDVQTLTRLRYKFAGKIPNLRNQIMEELIAEGYLPSSPQSVRRSYSILAALIFVLGIASLFFLGVFLGDNAGLVCFPVFAIIITAIALFIAARHMPKKTVKGTEAALKWDAFKTYLKNIKQYADFENSSDIFDKYLSYAIAFGLERTFINAFAQSPGTTVPPWYVPTQHMPGPVIVGGMPGTSRPSSGTGGSSGGGSMPNLGDVSGGLTGGLAGMSAGLTRMLNNTSTTMKSVQPTTSSGTRYGGGGFSGGSSGGFSGGSSGGGGSAGFG
ncbi:MAG: DUF2207 domain-containing protein [Anaerolineae bacterium]|nr:DUF2207 domain-containing protein [Anaerolineae bacterium]